MKQLKVIAVLVLNVMYSCTKSTDSNQGATTSPAACTGSKTFSSDVAPIIQSVCATSGCHDASSANGPGPLTTYQQVFNARTQIRSAVSTGLMPKNGTLTADQKAAILCWIDAGATNN